MTTFIRPTASLAKRMKLKLTESEERSTGKLGDWYANDIVFDRKQYILCICEHARLAVLLNAAPYSSWPHRLVPAVRQLLLDIGASREGVDAEIESMAPIGFAKTNSRSVLGSMFDLTFQLEGYSYQGRLSPESVHSASVWMAEIISLILPHGTPRDTALALLGPSKRSNLRLVPRPK